VVGGVYDWLSVWEVASGKQLFRLPHGSDSWVTDAVVATQTPLALSGGWDGRIKLWDLTTGQALGSLPLHQTWLEDGVYAEKRVTALAITPNGHWALSAGDDGSIVSVDVRAWSVRHRLSLPNLTVVRIALTPDGRRALSATSDHCLQVWNLVDGEICYPEPILSGR
jgi:WD40 repeat protein